MTGTGEHVRFVDVLADAQFRALWAAQVLSVLGDQVARVALSVLVFDRTASPALTALTYALTFVPDLVGGPLLSGLADRHPRRATMIVADLARAALVALMALPGMPFVVLCALLVGGQLLASPFAAARAAILPHVLGGERYVVASAVTGTTYQVAQVLGFALGGPVVAGLGVGPALLLDAGTFAVSAVVLRAGVAEQRPGGGAAAGGTAAGGSSWSRRLVDGARVVWGVPRLRALVALACVSSFVVTVEGLAAPYAAELGGGPATVGLLLAANPMGAAVGIVVLARWVPVHVRMRLLGPLAVASCAPLLVCALAPPTAVVVAAWAVSGLACAYQVPANAAFVAAVPDDRRGQAFGLAVTALRVTQGVGVLAAGLAAGVTTPSATVAGAGAVGVVVAGGCARLWRRAGLAAPEGTRRRPRGGGRVAGWAP